MSVHGPLQVLFLSVPLLCFDVSIKKTSSYLERLSRLVFGNIYWYSRWCYGGALIINYAMQTIVRIIFSAVTRLVSHTDANYADDIALLANAPSQAKTQLHPILFTNPSARAGYDTRSIFKPSLTRFNSEFSFS